MLVAAPRLDWLLAWLEGVGVSQGVAPSKVAVQVLSAVRRHFWGYACGLPYSAWRWEGRYEKWHLLATAP